MTTPNAIPDNDTDWVVKLRSYSLAPDYIRDINGMSEAIWHNGACSFEEVARRLAGAIRRDLVGSLKQEYRTRAEQALEEDSRTHPERYLSLAMEVIAAHQQIHLETSRQPLWQSPSPTSHRTFFVRQCERAQQRHSMLTIHASKDYVLMPAHDGERTQDVLTRYGILGARVPEDITPQGGCLVVPTDAVRYPALDRLTSFAERVRPREPSQEPQGPGGLTRERR